MERAHLSEGALLALRTGRGAWHAEALEGEATFGANRRTARPAQLVLLGPADGR
jgi:hypothetical protein